jgi:tRNA(Phe) wybutosine-synthesizing methylase Tyw3
VFFSITISNTPHQPSSSAIFYQPSNNILTIIFSTMTTNQQRLFLTRKERVLSKRDKSSAGRIDARAVSICAAINARAEYYTTSSCSGRCFLYVGDGIKSWHTAAASDRDESAAGEANKIGFFKRFRVSHGRITTPARYFDLQTLMSDATGGCGDPIPSVGQFENFGNNAAFAAKIDSQAQDENGGSNTEVETPIWLRYEPFILHVMCRSLKAASVLMALARPSFKNVGLTSWNSSGNDDDETADETAAPHRVGAHDMNQQCKGGGAKYLVAIWGDEGLDMPLSLPSSPRRGIFYNSDDGTDSNAEWLAQLVNERHARNWSKIERFVEAVAGLDENMEVDVDISGMSIEEHDEDSYIEDNRKSGNGAKAARLASGLPIPRSWDVIGDVAVLNSLPEGDEETLKKVGEWILSRNKAIKVRCQGRSYLY